MPTEPTIDRLEDTLIALGQQLDSRSLSTLRHPSQDTMPEWQGADVRLTSDFACEPRNFFDAHNLLVRTRHVIPVTWLFFELRDAFDQWLDSSNKYAFF